MWTRLKSLPKWPGWISAALPVLYKILDFVSNVDFVIEKYTDPKWLAPILAFLLNPPPLVQMTLFVFGIVWLTFVYRPALFTTSKAQASKEPQLEIRFTPRKSPFVQADRHMKLFSIGVTLNDSSATAEDVSVRLEKLEPNPSVPFLEFAEMVFPFAEHYAINKFQPARSVNVNPDQTRYFEIAFMYEGMQKPYIELCFFPSKFLLDAGRYVLGLRATGKHVLSDYVEFVVSVTSDGRLHFDQLDNTQKLLPAKPLVIELGQEPSFIETAWGADDSLPTRIILDKMIDQVGPVPVRVYKIAIHNRSEQVIKNVSVNILEIDGCPDLLDKVPARLKFTEYRFTPFQYFNDLIPGLPSFVDVIRTEFTENHRTVPRAIVCHALEKVLGEIPIESKRIKIQVTGENVPSDTKIFSFVSKDGERKLRLESS